MIWGQMKNYPAPILPFGPRFKLTTRRPDNLSIFSLKYSFPSAMVDCILALDTPLLELGVRFSKTQVPASIFCGRHNALVMHFLVS